MAFPSSTLICWKFEAATLKSKHEGDDQISELFALTTEHPTNFFLKFCGRTLSICSLDNSEHKLQFEFWVEDVNGHQIEKSDFASKYWILPNTLDYITEKSLFFCCSIYDSREEKLGNEIANVVELATALQPTSPFSFNWTLPQLPVNDEEPVNQFRSEKWTLDHKTEFESLVTIKNSNGRFLNGWHDMSVSLQSINGSTDDVWHVIAWIENEGRFKTKAQFFRFCDSFTEVPLWGWFGRSDEFTRTFSSNQSLSLQVRLVRVSKDSTPKVSTIEEVEFQIEDVNQKPTEILAHRPALQSELQNAIESETEVQKQLESPIVTSTRRKRSAQEMDTNSENEAEEDEEANHSSTDSESVHSDETKPQMQEKETDDPETTKKPLKSHPVIRAAAVLGLALVGWVVFNVTIAKVSNS